MLCFVDQGIETDLKKIDLVHTLLDLNVADTCRNKEKYKLAFRCAINIDKQCSSELDTLPDETKVAQGIDFLCQHANDLDEECLQRTGDEIKGCADIKTLRRFVRADPTDLTSSTCSYFQTIYDCTKEHRQVCSGNTLQIVLEVLNVYFRPPACSSFDNSTNNEGNPLTTLSPSTIAPTLTGRMSENFVNCSSIYSIQESQKECFRRENFTMEVPGVDARQTKRLLNDASPLGADNLQNACRNLRGYDRALECATEVTQKCLPLFASYIPTARSTKMMYKELCGNISVIDFECLKSASSRLFDCSYKKGFEIGRKGSLTNILCLTSTVTVECFLEVLPPCGCLMTKLFVETFRLYLTPSACTPVSVKIPECNSDMDMYM
ncbi:uncharacterized protein LOC112558803 isoform X9 [Pomacea canaliculata]|nr:uncharacterized protein LOC112558803 isoform X9 [Pomacea canaliculata]